MNYDKISINWRRLRLHTIVSFLLILIKILIENGVVSLQLPAKYTQLPALLIGYTMTLIWCIADRRRDSFKHSRHWL